MLNRFRLNIQVFSEALLLMVVTLGILAYFSHKALKQEALRNAEQTLEGTMQDIDNILLSVEQATGNIYCELVEHLDEPDRMFTYSRELVKSNPNINGCAIVFKPGYYPGKNLFMAYVHRKSSTPEDNTELETSETFAGRPYWEQTWYTKPMTGWTGWIDPLKGAETETEPLISFCLPFNDKNNQRVGVIAVDVSLHQLSKIIEAAKPSANGYCVLLARNGHYIVHPDKEKLLNASIFSQKRKNADPTETEAAEAMLAGEQGMKEFRMDDSDWCVFYKPFERVNWEGRTSGKNGWSIGVVYPEQDIYDTHNTLLYLIAGIAIAGLLLFYLLSTWIIRNQLKPLKQLAKSAQHIAQGNYNEMLPYTERRDEIGLLQERFEQMQNSLRDQVAEMEEETAQLRQEGDMLRAARDKAIETDNMKTTFLHFVTLQMSTPVEVIDSSVTTLCNNYHDISQQDVDRHVDNIQRKSHAMVELLNFMAHFTQDETGKEASHG